MPDSVALKMAPPGADAAVLNLWDRFRALNLLRRRTGVDAAAVRLELARHIRLHHQRLATPGAGGEFHGWLRLHRIPRASAYRLLKLVTPAETTPSNCLTGASTPPARYRRLDGGITIVCDNRTAALFAKAIDINLEANPQFDLVVTLLRALGSGVPEYLRPSLKQMWDRPESFYDAEIKTLLAKSRRFQPGTATRKP